MKPAFNNNQKCNFCKQSASKLSDKVIGLVGLSGHPRRIDGIIQYKESMSHNLTCDKPICDKCAIHLNEHMDICPDCYNLIKIKAGERNKTTN